MAYAKGWDSSKGSGIQNIGRIETRKKDNFPIRYGRTRLLDFIWYEAEMYYLRQYEELLFVSTKHNGYARKGKALHLQREPEAVDKS